MERLKPRTFSFWLAAFILVAAAFYVCRPGWNWQIFPNMHSTSFVYVVNAVLLASVSACFGIIAARLTENWIAGTLVGAILCVSPFSASVVLSPGGGETLLGLLGLGMLIAELFSVVTLPKGISVVLPAVLVVIAPEYSGAIIGCTVVRFSQRRSKGAAAAILLAVGAFVLFALFFMHMPNTAAAANSMSFTITMVALGVACFLMGPLLLAAARVVSSFGPMRGRQSFVLLILALLALVGGFILPLDPSPAILAAEACGLVAVAMASLNQGVTLASLALLGACSLFALKPIAIALPAIVSWHEDETLSAAFKSSQRGCIVSGSDNESLKLRNVLGGAAARWPFRRSVIDCLAVSPQPDEIVAVGEGSVRTWERGGIALALAELAHGDSSADKLSTTHATLQPKIGHPGGFPTSIETPLGITDGFTITAGYAYDFHCDSSRPPRSLTFAAYDPLHDYPHADPVRLSISVNNRDVFSRVLHPNDPAAADWHDYRVQLPSLRQCRDIRFSAVASSGSAVASWLSVAAPALHS